VSAALGVPAATVSFGAVVKLDPRRLIGGTTASGPRTIPPGQASGHSHAYRFCADFITAGLVRPVIRIVSGGADGWS
jgi:hypothetical protein